MELRAEEVRRIIHTLCKCVPIPATNTECSRWQDKIGFHVLHHILWPCPETGALLVRERKYRSVFSKKSEATEFIKKHRLIVTDCKETER